MKEKMKGHSRLLTTALAFLFVFLASLSRAGDGLAQLKQEPQVSPGAQQALTLFENRVKDYIKLRNKVKAKLPKLSKDSTPAQIESFKKNFEAGMRATRAGAQPGDIFNPAASDYIRRTLKVNFKGNDRAQLREIVFDGETATVKVRVNYPYPTPAEFVEMPATVLLKLPPLPKEVKYRFVGRNLLLLDNENNVIIDYMTNALP